MDTAVGKITVHTVDLRQVFGTADRADIHVELLVAAVIAVSQGQVDALVIAKLHRALDQCSDRTFVVADRITHILDFSAVAQLPETAFEILLLDRSDVLGYTYGRSETLRTRPYCLRNCSTCRPHRDSAGVP